MSTQVAQPVACPTCAAARASARLLIHVAKGVDKGGGKFSSALRGWRTWAVGAARHDPSAQVLLQVVDLQGRPRFNASELQHLTEVPLPAGTYHVNVMHGGQQRRYTVALEQGATFNLHLCAVRAAG